MADFEFSNRWFQTSKPVWDEIFSTFRPARILEIGSFEGASACYLITTIGAHQPVEIHCIDTWEGGIEHQAGGFVASNMSEVESRFHRNIALAQSRSAHPAPVMFYKNRSDLALAALLSGGKANYFDFIYVDGSHQAPDVLFDAVLSFKLLAINGLLIFDDYNWSENLPQGKDILRCPKPAIDAFVNLNFRKLRLLAAPINQCYVVKTAD